MAWDDFAKDKKEKKDKKDKKELFYTFGVVFPFIVLLFFIIVGGYFLMKGHIMWKTVNLEKTEDNYAIALKNSLYEYWTEYGELPPGKPYAGTTPEILLDKTDLLRLYEDPYDLPKVYNTFQVCNAFMFYFCFALILIGSVILLLLDFKKSEIKGIGGLFSRILFTSSALLLSAVFFTRVIEPGYVYFTSNAIYFLLGTTVFMIILRARYGENKDVSIFAGKVYLLSMMILVCIPLVFFLLKGMIINEQDEGKRSHAYFTNGDYFYLLISRGPNLKIDFKQENFDKLDISEEKTYSEILQQVSPYQYDATNGINSSGDIIHVGQNKGKRYL